MRWTSIGNSNSHNPLSERKGDIQVIRQWQSGIFDCPRMF